MAFSLDMIFGKARAKRMAWLTGGACAACCALPGLGLLLGSGALGGLAIYLEPVAALLALATAALLLGHWWHQRSAPACRLDCPSRDA